MSLLSKLAYGSFNPFVLVELTFTSSLKSSNVNRCQLPIPTFILYAQLQYYLCYYINWLFFVLDLTLVLNHNLIFLIVPSQKCFPCYNVLNL